MLKVLCTCALLMLTACGAAVVEEREERTAPVLDRPEWLELVAPEIDAIRACVRVRAPEVSVAVQVQRLNDLRVGVVTVGIDGGAERCVFRLDEIEYRASAKELRTSEFLGRAAVWVGSERPAVGVDAQVERVTTAEGATVAWVQWLGRDGHHEQ